MEKQALKQAILEQADQVDGKLKLSCAKALHLSMTLEISPAEIGRLCNENEIKISKCELGCFK